MIQILIFVLSVNPFYEANFTSLPMRSISIFSNPAGLGIQRGAESYVTCHPDRLMNASSLGNFGLGITKIDSVTYYETGLGLKLPGTIQTVKDKVISSGFLEIELLYEFSNTFRYPVVIEVKSSGIVEL